MLHIHLEISQKLELGAVTMGTADKETEMESTEVTLLFKCQSPDVQSSPSALPPPSPKTWGSLGLRESEAILSGVGVWGRGVILQVTHRV